MQSRLIFPPSLLYSHCISHLALKRAMGMMGAATATTAAAATTASFPQEVMSTKKNFFPPCSYLYPVAPEIV